MSACILLFDVSQRLTIEQRIRSRNRCVVCSFIFQFNKSNSYLDWCSLIIQFISFYGGITSINKKWEWFTELWACQHQDVISLVYLSCYTASMRLLITSWCVCMVPMHMHICVRAMLHTLALVLDDPDWKKKYSDFMCSTQGNWIFHCVIWSTLAWGKRKQMRRLIRAFHSGMLFAYW